MTDKPVDAVLDEAAVIARLSRELPDWRLENGAIRRKYRTHGWKATTMAVGCVAHLAEAAWHHPEISLSYGWLEVSLRNHAAKGITDKDFALARKIDDVLLWRPGNEDGPLEGTPADPRFAYMRFE